MTDPGGAGEDSATGHEESRWQRLFTAAQDRGVPLRTIVTVDAVVIITWVAYRLLGRLREIILWILIAGFIALVLNPAVVFLQRHRRSRGQAVGIVFLVALLAFIGLLGLFGYPLVNALSHFATKLPSMVSQLEKGHGKLARTLQHFHLLTWVQTNAPKLQQAAQKLGKPALSVGANLGKAVLSTMLALFTIAFLSLFMLLYAPNMRAALLKTLAPERRQTVEEVGTKVSRAVTSYVLGTVALSLAFGVVVFVTLAILGVPFALLIGLWVALVAMIPLVGGLIAAVPSVLIALLSLADRRAGDAGGLHRVPAGREPFSLPDRHGPDRSHEPPPGAPVGVDRGQPRRRVRVGPRGAGRRPGRHPGGSGHPGDRQGAVARDPSVRGA